MTTPTPSAHSGEQGKPSDVFAGDDAKLVYCINALLQLDATGKLVPHGIGWHARTLLTAAAARLDARELERSSPEQSEPVCKTCEGTGLANVVDQDDGALVIDDCPECGGESAFPRGVGSETEGALRWIMRAADAAKEPCGSDPESRTAIRNGKLASIAQVAAQALGMVIGPSLAHHAPEAQAEGEPIGYVRLSDLARLRAGTATSAALWRTRINNDLPVYLRPQPSASETPSSANESPSAKDAWLPIETAPKIGRLNPLILRRGVPFIGYWDSRDGVWKDCGGFLRDPTHWLPLAAIAAQRKEGE